jgi:osmotically-inducible protein OsmY
VKSVANELEVRLADTERDDSDIARAIAHILDWNTTVPTGLVKALVENGWVTLEGVVEFSFQRDEVERMVSSVRGVVGVTNNIEVKPQVTADEVEAKIAEAFRRQAELDARRVRVEVIDRTAHLYGHVHSTREAAAARAAAARAPGIARVEDHLAVVP